MTIPTDYDELPSPVPGYKTRKDLLTDMYVNQGLPISIIALRLDQSTTTITRWLLENSIPTRPRGGPNASGAISWTLHRMDPRFVRVAPLHFLARITDSSQSAVYKYRRKVLPK